MQSSSELYQILKNNIDSTGLPIIPEGQFQNLTQEIGRDTFRETLAEFIFKERPKFPLYKISIYDMDANFKKLMLQNYKKFFKTDVDVMEKFDDCLHSYPKSGLGIIDAPSVFNTSSNYFHQDLRLNFGSWKCMPPIGVWTTGTAKEIWRCLGTIWRGINDVKKDKDGNFIGGKLDEDEYISSFRLGSYIATQFKPIVAKCIYQMSNANKVLDTSCGWGDRLCGFYASNAKEYIGCDPNPNTYERYKKQCIEYERLLGNIEASIEENKGFFVCEGEKKVTIYRCGAEDLPWQDINEIDCSFTSPPYFSTEEYNKGGEHQEDQSWAKFNEYNLWRDKFFLPVSRNSFDSLSEKGLLAINIYDPIVEGVRYRTSDELCTDGHLSSYFLGQIGMRIMQRPHGKVKFKGEDGLLDKKQLDEYMKKIYIENIWCFSRNENFDLLQRSSLERFMS